MRSLRQWVSARMVDGYLPVVIAAALCSPVGAAVALAGEPHDGGAQSSRSGKIVLGGLTSNGWPVYVELAANGRSIIRAVGAINGPCTKGESWTVADRWMRVPVRRRRFRTGFRDSFTDQGARIEVASTFAGKVNRARTVVSGTWSNKVVIHEPDGSVDTCDSGLLRFKAKR